MTAAAREARTRTVALLGIMLAATGGAEEPATALRPVLEAARDAVITVRITSRSGVSYRGAGERGESVAEVTGCVIHPTGLTAVALSTFDASKRMSQSGSRGGDSDMKYESEVAEVVMILPDASEVSAELVMRDADLDLAYIRPLAAPARPLASFSLTRSGRPRVLETVLVVDRLGVIANRNPAARVTRIAAVIEKPRWAAVIESSGLTGLGAAVLTPDGAFAGLVAMRTIRRDPNARGPSSMSVVVPASDVADGAAQAMAVQRKPARKP